MRVLTGVAASPGVATGPIHVHRPARPEIPDGRIAEDRRAAEVEAFLAGRAKARDGLDALARDFAGKGDDDLAALFEGHAEILMDEDLGASILALIRDEGRSALAAARDALAEQKEAFLALDDDYMRQRAADLDDIARRLILAIAGIDETPLDAAPPGAVIVAADLGPSDTARLDPARVGGFVLAVGGRTGHVAIMARTRGIPAVVGCAGILEAVAGAAEIALDGDAGRVVVAPDAATRAAFGARAAAATVETAALRALAPLPAITRDGRRVMLAANIGTEADAEAALAWNPDGIGLYRTEFLFMDRTTLPDEEEQYRAYTAVVRSMAGRPVVIRSLDVGGDKPLPGLGFAHEDNPFLGWRGARLFAYGAGGTMPNRDPAMRRRISDQLGAILRAAAVGDVRLMYPMIACLEEVDVLAGLLDEEKERLRREGRSFGSPKVGVMIETPAAALIADRLAEKVDFFSIGSNDLTQYALAADRGNDRVARICHPFHPAVWRLVAMVARAARAGSIPVAMCGELAGMEEAALPLVGLGLDELSMAAPSLPRIKRILRAASSAEAEAVAAAVLDAPTADAALTIARRARDAALAAASA
jgi:phosphotransferase system enzyme I (PtsI)